MNNKTLSVQMQAVLQLLESENLTARHINDRLYAVSSPGSRRVFSASAEALGIKVAALKSWLLRARLLMRQTLAGQLEEPPSLTTRVVHAAIDVGTAVAMKLMRAAGM
jgi:hypothetical protein